MTTNVAHYLNGMIGWSKLTRSERLWVYLYREAACPADARLQFMSE